MKNPFIQSLLILLVLGTSCTTNNVVCSQEYTVIGITVKGEPLTDFYTLRLSNNEVINHPDFNSLGDNWYPVLTDDYHPKIIESQDKFRFVGSIGSVVVVNEIFSIAADRCHLKKKDGVDKVTIDINSPYHGQDVSKTALINK